MSESKIRRIDERAKPGAPRPAASPPGPQKAAPKPPRRGFLTVLVVLIALVAAYQAYLYETTANVALAVIKRQPLAQTLVASGQVETPFRLNVSAQVIGTVADVPVQEGQTVKAGDVLVRLNDEEAAQGASQAQAAVDQASARLLQMQDVAGKLANETLRQAQSTLVNAKTAFDRASTLASQGYLAKTDLDTARHNLEIAQSQVTAAALQVATNNPGGRDYQLAQTQLDQAEAALKAAQTRITYTEIRSPRDGTLISRNVERGQVVQPGAALMVLAPSGQIQLVAQVDELNLGLLQIGQKATAVADAYPGKPFDAVLSYINPGIDSQHGTVEVKLDVPSPPAFITQDMSASVEIIVASRDSAIAVEITDVNDLNSAKPWVWVLKDGRAHRQDIKKGLAGDSTIEVTDGLNEGDQVIKAQGRALSENQRVRVKAP